MKDPQNPEIHRPEDDKPVVALVHEQSLVRLSMETALSKWFRVCIFSNVEDALVFTRSTRTLDALVTDLDLGLSALGGCNIARDARDRFPALPVFVFSNGDPGDHRLVILRGMNGVHILSKPFGAFFLAKRLRRALNTREGK